EEGVAGVARRGDDDDAGDRGGVGGDRGGVQRPAEVAAQRHVDDVEVVGDVVVVVGVHRPVDGEGGEAGAAEAAEDAQAVERRLRRGARADAHGAVVGGVVPGAGVGAAVGVDAVAGGGARDVAAVTV